MADEDLREIQLNGKQLVFLFMAATVGAVVIFLCGVMVGRGVRAQRVDAVAASTVSPADPTASATATSVAAAVEGAPQTTREQLTYPKRLEEEAPVRETLGPAPSASTTDGPEPAAEPIPVVPESAPAQLDLGEPATRVAGEPSGTGFVVQVAAVRERAEAEAIALRLSGKGYPAFVTTPAGVARVFRVRVGKYKERREADRIAVRLEKEEQFKPWITR